MAILSDIIRRITIQSKTEGAAQTASELKGIATAQETVGKASLSMAGKLETLQKQLDVTYRNEQKLAQAEKTLSAARAQGLLTIERQNELLSLASVRFGEAGEAAKVMGERLDQAKEFAMGLIGGLGVGVAFTALDELPGKILEINHEAAGLTHTAETIGLTTTALQELNFAAAQAHVGPDEMAKALETFAKNIGLAERGTGDLAKVLALNHVAISGNVAQDFLTYANLIKGTADAEERARLITDGFGKSAEGLAPILIDGADGVLRLADAAEHAGAVLGGPMLENAAKLDAQFTQTQAAWDNAFKDFAITVAPPAVTGLENITTALKTLQLAADESKTGNLIDLLYLVTGQGAYVSAKMEAMQFARPPHDSLGTTGNAGTIPSFPDVAVGDRADEMRTCLAGHPADHTGVHQANQYRDLMAAADGTTASLNAEAAALGKTTLEAARMDEQQKLLNQAHQDGLTLSPKQLAAIDNEAQAYAVAVDNLAKLNELYDTGKSATEDFFSTLKSDLQNGTSLWQSFGDAAGTVLDDLANKALQMGADGIWNAIFGGISGSLGGGSGGSILSLFGIGGSGGGRLDVGLPHFANGGSGVVGGSGGVDSQLFIARATPGEPYAFGPQAISGGGGAQPVVVHNHIDARGAQSGVGAEIARALSNFSKNELPTRLKQITANPYRKGYAG